VAVRVLGAIGGGAVGAMLLGWLVQLVVKLSFAQNVPPWMLWIVRVLGGVACGLLVWSLLGGGGGGLGFGGGSGGRGKGTAQGKGKEERKDKDRKQEKEKDKVKKDATPTPPGQELRIEVLGDEDLKRIAGSKFDPKRRYRVPGQPGLLTLAEAQALILKRHEGKP